jgi:hypothetical protein
MECIIPLSFATGGNRLNPDFWAITGDPRYLGCKTLAKPKQPKFQVKFKPKQSNFKPKQPKFQVNYFKSPSGDAAADMGAGKKASTRPMQVVA